MASKFALLCLAQFPANTLDAVMTKMKILVDKAFMFSPFLSNTEKVISGHGCLKYQINNCGEMTRLLKKKFKKIKSVK